MRRALEALRRERKLGMISARLYAKLGAITRIPGCVCAYVVVHRCLGSRPVARAAFSVQDGY